MTINPITTSLIAAILHSTEPMVLTDPHAPDHPMIAVNEAFERLTGYTAAETVGRNCRFLQGAQSDRETVARIRTCLAEQRGCVEWIINYRKDGSVFWNLLFLSPVLDDERRLIHYFGNQRDITGGFPPGLPDYTLGRAAMPMQGQAEFSALLHTILTEAPAADDEGSRSRALERIVEAARRLNDVTTRLAPAPWEPPR